MWNKYSQRLFFSILTFLLLGNISFAQDLSALGLPALTAATGSSGETTYSLSLQILLLMTALTVLPSLVLGMTAFTRIIIVLSILRQALGTQQTPPNQVLIAIALFLSFLTSWRTANSKSISFSEGHINSSSSEEVPQGVNFNGTEYS